MLKVVMHKKRLGIIGGGQLARMLAQEAKKFDLPLKIYASDPNKICPAADYVEQLIEGDYKDSTTLQRVAAKCDLISYEIELASAEALMQLEASGQFVYPPPLALKIIQDKFSQSVCFKQLDLPIPEFCKIDNRTDLISAVQQFGLPLMIKARCDSYDGKGNFLLKSENQIEQVFEQFATQSLMAQQFIDFDGEISVICAGSRGGQQVTFPAVQNLHGHDYHILHRSIAPAQLTKSLQNKAQDIARKIVKGLKGVGVFTVEFLVQNEKLYINEVAPRVHNSGHLTIEACDYSQFHLHLLCGIKECLPQPVLSSPALMQNIIGPKDFTGKYEIAYKGELLKDLDSFEDRLFFHLYGKVQSKPYRKLGHWTLIAKRDQSIEDLHDEADAILTKISIQGAN